MARGNDIITMPDGGALIAGYAKPPTGDPVVKFNGAWVARLDAAGGVLWTELYGANELDLGGKLAVLPDASGFVLGGRVGGLGGGVTPWAFAAGCP